MKNIIIIIGIIAAFSSTSKAQNINWRALNNEQKNIIGLNLGYDFGANAQLGYYRSINAFKPILIGGDFSLAGGEDLTDDFKIRWGGQIALFESNGFSVSGKVMGNFKRHQTDLVRMVSFGTELSVLSGYYKPTWHIAVEAGFDKSISTQLKHSDTMKDIYADVKDGWYSPTSGNWFYGIQGSKSIGKSIDITSRLGVTNAQGKDVDSVLPFYFQIGINKRF